LLSGSLSRYVPNQGPSQQVDFVGHLTKAPANDTSSLGVEKSGQPLLQKQGAYVIVSVGDLSPH
jgi:hypothetical protein